MRATLMAEHAAKVLELRAHGHLCKKGVLSSFHIPDKPINHPVWKQCYSSFEASQFRCRLLREKRLVLEEHTRVDNVTMGTLLCDNV